MVRYQSAKLAPAMTMNTATTSWETQPNASRLRGSGENPPVDIVVKA